MPRFGEIPKFILLDFLRKRTSSSSSTSGSVIYGPQTLLVAQIDPNFYGVLRLANDDGGEVLVEIPFQPKNLDEDDFWDEDNHTFYLTRMTSLETSATSGLSLTSDSDFYLYRRKGGQVHQYLHNLIETGPTFTNTIPMDYFININKPLLYIGKLYPQNDGSYKIDYWGLDRYAETAIPEHNLSPKLKELFKIGFDQVYNSIYNRIKQVPTLLDPEEIDLDFIQSVANIYGMELDKSFYEALFLDRLSTETQVKERRSRNIVSNTINYLKRKGTYSSLFSVFKSLFNPTENILNVYERWHQNEVFNLTHPYDLEPYFEDFNYLSYYGSSLSGCVSGGYYSTLTATGFSVSLDNCYIHRQGLPNSQWFVTHNLVTQVPFVQVYDNNLNIISPVEIVSIGENFSVIDFATPIAGNALFVKPDAIFTQTSGLSYWNLDHNLGVEAPLVVGYEPTTFTYTGAQSTIPASAQISFYTVQPSGDMSVYVLNTEPITESYTVAISADYIHNQTYLQTDWTITHNLESKSLVADFYTTFPASGWNITHGLDTQSVLVQPFTFEHESKPYTSLDIHSESLVKIVFTAETDGYVSLKEGSSQVLESAIDWVVKHNAGVYCPLIQVFDSTYAEVDYTTISIIPSGDLNTISISAAGSTSGYVHYATPDYLHENFHYYPVWHINHNLNSKNLLVDVYTMRKSDLFGFANIFRNSNVLYQFYDFKGIQVYPQYVTIGPGAITLIDSYQEFEGFVVGASATYSDSTGSSASWVINHDLQPKLYPNVVSQFQDASGNVFIPELLEATGESNLLYTPPSPKSGSVHVTKGHFVYEHPSPSATWWVEHYLDTKKILVTTYTPHASGTYDLKQGEPLEIRQYNNNVLKISWSAPTSGYAVVKVGDVAFIPSVEKTGADIELTSWNDLSVTLSTSALGYVAVAEADNVCVNMKQTTPKSFEPIDENTSIATFEASAMGLATLREVGTFTYAEGLVITPHYKVEIDATCEPLCGQDILTTEHAEALYDLWEKSRPADKYAHYHLLLSPSTNFTGETTTLYNASASSVEVYTKCCTDTVAVSPTGSYVYGQGVAADTWFVEHNLGSKDLIIQCYDLDLQLIFPAGIVIVDENNIRLTFFNDATGVCFISVAEDHFMVTDETSASWSYSYTPETSASVADFYLYTEYDRVFPSNVQIVSVDEINATWYVPTLGYCKIRSGDYLHVQSTPSYKWLIQHNLPKRGVIVKVYDENLNELFPANIELYRNEDTVEITFSQEYYSTPVNGYAVLVCVGGFYTPSIIAGQLRSNGYIKIGNGEDVIAYDSEAYNDLKSPLLSDFQYPVIVTEDTNYYYVKGTFIGNREATSITEFGLFDGNNNLIFYSYIHGGQLYKHKNFDFTIFYIIRKP